MAQTRFTKMHGLGNDFVVIDVRAQPAAPALLSGGDARAIADRNRGLGCDQVIVIERAAGADAFMRIFNADGGEVRACGNGARCVGSVILGEKAGGHAILETISGPLAVTSAPRGLVTVDMGPARAAWQDIPLAREMDTLHLDLALDPGRGKGLTHAVGVNMGNPHAVFFVDDADAFDLAQVGPKLEHDPLFPERANITLAQVVSRTGIRARVWERGVGITAACGSAACATLVAAARRGLTERRGTVRLTGGALQIEWRGDGHVLMTGPVATSFTGAFDLDALRNGAAA
jgi:diaminopimelate epimerase